MRGSKVGLKCKDSFLPTEKISIIYNNTHIFVVVELLQVHGDFTQSDQKGKNKVQPANS